MAATRSPKTFHIFYAWAEGPWHGRALKAALEQAGFREAPQGEATVVVAHSVGCYLLPATETNKIILLIGPPYWPGRSIGGRSMQKVWHDYRSQRRKLTYWLRKTAWSIIYIVAKPSLTVRAWHAIHQPNPFSTLPQRTVIIRNEADNFCTPELEKLIRHHVVVLRGQHDDCWHHPESYVNLVQSEYARLLA